MTAAAADAAREAAVRATMARVRAIEMSRGVSRDSLESIKAELLALAAQEHLFPSTAFPPPPPGEPAHRRYLLHEEADGRFALYLNALNPGRDTAPHDHTTWACVVAVEGEELNRLYVRTDDGTPPGKATLKPVREVVVKPGQGIALMPDEIHSIHITGDRPTRHLHCYGLALEKLDRRMGYDLAAGTVVPYNQSYMNPTENR